MRLRAPKPTYRAEAAAARRLAHFYRAEADLCGCAHLTKAAALCQRRARKLDLEARKAT